MATEITFFILLFISLGFLLAAMGIARWNWQTGIAPFSRRTNAIDILINPDRYVERKQVPVVRFLSIVGGVLLIGALISLGKGLLATIQ
jgi:hypothetical protein